MPYTDHSPRRSSMAPRRRSLGDSESRRASHVRFDDEDEISQAFREAEDLLESLPSYPAGRSPAPEIASPQPARPSRGRPEWHTPDYQSPSQAGNGLGIVRAESEVSPLSPARDSKKSSDPGGSWRL